MPADALIDVRRHVDHVPGARHQRHEAIGFRLGALRIGRLPEVNPQVQRTGMTLVADRSRTAARLCTSCGLFVQLTVAREVSPRPQIHQRFGVERARIEIVRDSARVSFCIASA